MNLTHNEFEKAVKQKLQNSLAGADAHKQMMPEGRSLQPLINDRVKQSAVLIAFYKENKQWVFPIIKRATYKGVHSGQMALPGGKFELKDKNLKTTALREAYEEIGIYPNSAKVLGTLTKIDIPVSNTSVLPVVACLRTKPKLFANKNEVDRISIIRIIDLLDTKNQKSEVWNIKGENINIPFYYLDKQKVWGATAMILSELKTLFMN